MNFSNRVLSVQESPIFNLVPYVNEAKKKGMKVYHLNIGQPDIKTPDGFFDVIKNFKQEVLAYAPTSGIPELVTAIIDYYKTFDMHFEQDEVAVTNGGSEALLFAMLTICDGGDNILIPEPFYTNYSNFAQALDVNFKPVTTKAEDGFHLPSKEEIVKQIDNKTRAILLSNPGNPTGVVYTKEEVHMIADIAKEHNLFIIADEVYREFVYGGLDYTSFGNIKEVEDKVVIVDSVSKRYSACGARIGSLASKNKGFMKQISKLCVARLCVPTLEQIGCVELYKTPNSYFEEVNAEYMKRRDVLYDGLMKIPNIICEKPTGAFYIVAKLPVKNAENFAKWMLQEFNLDGETLMVSPAEGFYITEGLGRNEIRLAYVLNTKDLSRCAKILKTGLEKYLAEIDK